MKVFNSPKKSIDFKENQWYANTFVCLSVGSEELKQ